MAKKKIKTGKKQGNLSRQELYAKTSKHAPRAIEVLLELMENGDNDNVRLGAAKCILAKTIPDIRATEITGEGGGPIDVNIVKDFIYDAQPGGTVSSPDTSPEGQT